MNLPKDGWSYLSTMDLKSVCGNCGLCGTPIRYVHRIEHKGADIVLEIGCECASNVMNGADLDYIRDQDKKIKDEARREKAKDAQLKKYYEAKKEFCIKRGLPVPTWDEYMALVEKNTRRK